MQRKCAGAFRVCGRGPGGTDLRPTLEVEAEFAGFAFGARGHVEGEKDGVVFLALPFQRLRRPKVLLQTSFLSAAHHSEMIEALTDELVTNGV